MKITSAALFISMSLVVFGICYYYFTTRHRERMTILEKGLPSNYFKNSINYLPLIMVLGICCISIAIGTLIGGALYNLELEYIGMFVFPVTIFLFLGGGLIISYYWLNKINRKDP